MMFEHQRLLINRFGRNNGNEVKILWFFFNHVISKALLASLIVCEQGRTGLFLHLAREIEQKTGFSGYYCKKSIMGRPPTLPLKKKDGWYLEVRNKGAKSGTVLIRDTEEAMHLAARLYQNTKDVIIMGEHRNGKKVESEKKKGKKA